MNDSTSLLTLDNISQCLAGRDVVHPLNLSLLRGEVLGLLGVNGAGKSTTLKMIAGVLAPATGNVCLNGVDLYEHPELARHHIGYLPENPPLYDELYVSEYLRFCAALRGAKGRVIEQQVRDVVACCELDEVQHRLIGVLSKGFRQRVGLAQAILHKPALIVLDEPASGLDPVQALKLRDLIRSLSKEHAVILSTHMLSDVVACCDRVGIFHAGQLRYESALSALPEGTTLEEIFMQIVAKEKIP